MSDTPSQRLYTREELIAQFQNENMQLIAMIIEIEGYEEVLEYTHDMEDLPQELFFIIPEKSKYYLTIKYKVSRPFKNLTYHQVVKKGGFVFKQRKEPMAEYVTANDESTPYHSITFPVDEIPGGSLIRGTYPASSTFYSDGKEILKAKWTIKIAKKDTKPSKGGYK